MAVSETLRIVIQTTADTTGFQVVEVGYEQIGRAVEESNRQSQLFFTELRSAYQTLAGVAQQAWQFMANAAREAGVRDAFRELTAEAGISSSELLRAMDEAAAGTLSAQRIMQNANRLLVSGLDITVQQMSDLLLIARDRAQAMGISVQQAYDDIITGVTRSSPMILDNLGLIVRQGEANEQLAEQLGITVEQMTAEERASALLTQVLADNADAVQELRGETRGLADDMAQLQTAAENFQSRIGLIFEEILEGTGLVDELSGVLDTLAQSIILAASAIQGASAFLDVFLATGDAAAAGEKAGKQFEHTFLDLGIAAGLVDESIANTNKTTEQFTRTLDETRATAKEAGEELQGLVDNLAEVARTMQEAEAIKFKRELDDAQQAMQDAADEAAQFQERLTDLEERFDDRRTDIVIGGEQKRADIRQDYANRLFDLLQDHEDELLDLAIDGSDRRQDIETDYWREIRDIRQDSSRDINEAIRDRDARALADARRQRRDDLRDAREDRDDSLQDLDRFLDRRERDENRDYQRRLRDQQQYLGRALRDQQTAEQRMMQDALRAYERSRQQAIAQYQDEELLLSNHLSNMITMKQQAATAFNAIPFKTEVEGGGTKGSLGGGKGGNLGFGKPVSGGRGRGF